MPPYEAKLTPDEDGRFHCKQPGCEDVSYELPQHLGLHMRHKHGVQGQSDAAKARRRSIERQTSKRAMPVPVKRAMPVTVKQAYQRRQATNGFQRTVTAEEVCQTLMSGLVSSGYIRVGALSSYVEWVKSTEAFLETLGDS